MIRGRGTCRGVALPGGNGAALSTEACLRYTEALAAFREACGHRRAIGVRELLDRLLRLFAERYARAKRERLGAGLRGPRARGPGAPARGLRAARALPDPV